jgi:hypothetical protein
VSRFLVEWKLLFGVGLPVAIVTAGLAVDAPLVAVGAVASVALALVVVLAFVRAAPTA